MLRGSAGTADECKSRRRWVTRRSLRAGRKFAATRKTASRIDDKAVQIKVLYRSPEISGHECPFDLDHIIGATYRAGEAGAQATAQSERIRPWLVANRFHAISQASMMSARLLNTELASQWLRR